MAEWGELKDLPPQGERPDPKRIDCFKCVYFKISWDPKFPRTCEFFGFSGQELPSATVREASGKDCPAFKLKQKFKKPFELEGDEDASDR